MFTILLVLQILVAAGLVAVILMQRSEGGGLGVGGSSSGLMTARGAADFLTRAVECSPRDGELWLDLQEVHAWQGRREPMEQAWERALALLPDPRLLILDSPTVGVDVGARAGIFEVVDQLAKAGLAILLISDEAPEVYFNADRILHMRDGRLIEEFVPARTTLAHVEEAVHA